MDTVSADGFAVFLASPFRPEPAGEMAAFGSAAASVALSGETKRLLTPLITPEPLRHQVWDLPEIKPLVTEYQLHRLTCPCCSKSTCGELPCGVPRGQAGPRLIALTALLMGCFKQSKRRVALFLEQVLNQPCSPGWVVKLQDQATAALLPAYQELAAQLPSEEVLGAECCD